MDIIKNNILREKQKPMIAAVFGQTGCGKSSLINAVFGTTFEVNDVHPCTKEPQKYQGKDAGGNPVIFYDLPGIGESTEADKKYLEMYIKIASKCDVILWAFQADTRSIGLDVLALEYIISQKTDKEKQEFLNMISVIVTKADSVNFDSWIFAKNGESSVINAGDKTEKILYDKAKYFRDGLLGKYDNIIINRTYISEKSHSQKEISDGLSLDKEHKFIYYHGVMDESKKNILLKKYPLYSAEISRLYDYSRGVFCSSVLQFNLYEVKKMIIEKARGTSSLRISQSFSKESNSISWSEVKKLSWPIFWDNNKDTKIHI